MFVGLAYSSLTPFHKNKSNHSQVANSHLKKSDTKIVNNSHKLGYITLLILFVFGCVCAAGYLNGVVLGGCAVSLATVGTFLILPKMCRDRERCKAAMEIILALGYIIAGACALTGTLSPSVAGYSIIAPTIIVRGLQACYCLSGVAMRSVRMARQERDRVDSQEASHRNFITMNRNM
jgi:hypothetical protein